MPHTTDFRNLIQNNLKLETVIKNPNFDQKSKCKSEMLI